MNKNKHAMALGRLGGRGGRGVAKSKAHRIKLRQNLARARQALLERRVESAETVQDHPDTSNQ